jgi:hypothetical protein
MATVLLQAPAVVAEGTPDYSKIAAEEGEVLARLRERGASCSHDTYYKVLNLIR